jgi:dihydropteroate synthase
MAVLNVTPDSFYDGGRYSGNDVLRHIDALFDEGAFVVDIGAESTRPGASPVPTAVQLERLLPAVRYAAVVRRGWVSVDTTDPVVADAALREGAQLINDVSCLERPELAKVAGQYGAALLLMHARGSMEKMEGFSRYPEDGYSDVVADVRREWILARDRAISAGFPKEDILFDPGLGFAKNAEQSMVLLARLQQFNDLNTPVVVGPSRKSFLNLIEESPPESRLGATAAACLFAAEQGAMLVRVHDVQVVRQALAANRYFERARDNRAQREATCSTAS